MSIEFPNRPSNNENWRDAIQNLDTIPPDLATQMDELSALFNTGNGHQQLEELVAEMAATQKAANATYGTTVEKANSKLRIAAIIRLARNQGLITPEEERDLKLKIQSRT